MGLATMILCTLGARAAQALAMKPKALGAVRATLSVALGVAALSILLGGI
jgi:hypothetical protein